MSTTLVLKNVPEHVFDGLGRRAEIQGRTISDEDVCWLDATLPPPAMAMGDRLARIRQLRETLPGDFQPEHIDDFKREGRS